MKRVLEQLYNGEIMPIEQYRPILEDYRSEFMKKVELYAKKLNVSQREELEILMDDYLNMFPVEMLQEFTNGFKLGAHLMCEVFSEQGDNYMEYFSQMKDNPIGCKGV